MKKTLKTWIMCLTLITTTAVIPQQSNALLVGTNPETDGKKAAYMLGLSAIPLGGILRIASQVATTNLVGAVLMAVGLVILDDQGAGSLQYTELTPAAAQKIGLTQDELVAYNENIEVFNAVLTDMASTYGNSITAQEATQAWKNAEQSLGIPKAAVDGLRKVTYQLFR